MLYFLLTVIAVGILLASRPGQALLGFILSLGLVGLIFTLIGLVIAGIYFGGEALFTTETGSNILTVVGGVFLTVMFFSWLHRLYKDPGQISRGLKARWAEISPGMRTFLVLAIVGGVLLLLWTSTFVPNDSYLQ